MALLRFMPLLSAALTGLVFNASTCNKPDPGESKPPVTTAQEVTLKGVDTSTATSRERREWSAQITELLAPCPDVAVNIAKCVQESRPCKACLPAAQMLLKQVQAGRPKKEREDAFHDRFDPSKVKTLSIEGSPDVGPPDAPVTIVEWADFECPFCRLVYPILEDIVRRFPDQVRLVYKFYPLSAHPHGEIAARAGVAALNQGKFWEMHHTLFDHQESLEQADLDRYAKGIGLDLQKFRADLVSKETGERIKKDKDQADGIGLEGTPFLFINGRYVNLQLLVNPYDDMVEWVKLDIELAGKVPKMLPASSASAGPSAAPVAPPPSGSASAAPAASASAGAGKPAQSPPGKK
ncbi:MAG: thioredoxin domain-containing protein [Byssovorax sp.]